MKKQKPDEGAVRHTTWIPAEEVVQPQGIIRLRKALGRGEHGNPDADIPPLHRPEVMARYRLESSEEQDTYFTDVSEEAPQLFVLAGPNGSGKTSWLSENTNEVAGLGLAHHFNPDAIAREINPSDVAQAAVEAGREVLRRSSELLKCRGSFGVETTLAGRHTLRVMQQARHAGYEVTLMFVATENPRINIERVAARHAAGGHDVPTEDILRRYQRSLENLDAAVACADRIRLVDNSQRGQMREFARFDDGHLIIEEPVPNFRYSALEMLYDQSRRQRRVREEPAVTLGTLQEQGIPPTTVDDPVQIVGKRSKVTGRRL
ncbi:MAG TPA: zeta toxin family protein [Candidatus Baltobacteraceae bacterium]|jgi:predicted ABC-type ATPase|nr:zeta toxin family protein [Candidatus Baltobacteraceae bacterium]